MLIYLYSIVDQFSWMRTIGLKIFGVGAMVLRIENLMGAMRETVAVQARFPSDVNPCWGIADEYT